MSTHVDGLHTGNTRITLTTNDELAEHYPEIEESGDETVLALEAPGNCHLVTVEGDLETFARNVWSTVFNQDAPEPTHCDRNGGPRGSDETCQDCVDDEGRTRCGHNNQRLDKNRLVVCNDCDQTIPPTSRITTTLARPTSHPAATARTSTFPPTPSSTTSPSAP